MADEKENNLPVEEEGIEIGKIIVDNTELERENGKYSFNSEPWNTYCIYFYGEDGRFLGSKNILVNEIIDYRMVDKFP